MIKDIHDVKECPDCASENIVYGVREQIICRDCGLIFEPLSPAAEQEFEVAHDMAPRPAKVVVSKSVKKPAAKSKRAKPSKKPAKKAAKKPAKKPKKSFLQRFKKAIKKKK